MNTVEEENVDSFIDSDFIAGIILAITLGVLIHFYYELCKHWKDEKKKAAVKVSRNSSRLELQPAEDHVQQSKAQDDETSQEEKFAVMEGREVCVEAEAYQEQVINQEASSDC